MIQELVFDKRLQVENEERHARKKSIHNRLPAVRTSSEEQIIQNLIKKSVGELKELCIRILQRDGQQRTHEDISALYFLLNNNWFLMSVLEEMGYKQIINVLQTLRYKRVPRGTIQRLETPEELSEVLLLIDGTVEVKFCVDAAHEVQGGKFSKERKNSPPKQGEFTITKRSSTTEDKRCLVETISDWLFIKQEVTAVELTARSDLDLAYVSADDLRSLHGLNNSSSLREQNEKLTILRRCQLFSHLATPDTLKQNIDVFCEQSYQSGDLIYEVGDPANEIYIVVSGAFRLEEARELQFRMTVHRGRERGKAVKEVLSQIIGAEQWFGELETFRAEGARREARAVCLQSGSLYIVKKRDLLNKLLWHLKADESQLLTKFLQLKQQWRIEQTHSRKNILRARYKNFFYNRHLCAKSLQNVMEVYAANEQQKHETAQPAEENEKIPLKNEHLVMQISETGGKGGGAASAAVVAHNFKRWEEQIARTPAFQTARKVSHRESKKVSPNDSFYAENMQQFSAEALPPPTPSKDFFSTRHVFPKRFSTHRTPPAGKMPKQKLKLILSEQVNKLRAQLLSTPTRSSSSKPPTTLSQLTPHSGVAPVQDSKNSTLLQEENVFTSNAPPLLTPMKSAYQCFYPEITGYQPEARSSYQSPHKIFQPNRTQRNSFAQTNFNNSNDMRSRESAIPFSNRSSVVTITGNAKCMLEQKESPKKILKPSSKDPKLYAFFSEDKDGNALKIAQVQQKEKNTQPPQGTTDGQLQLFYPSSFLYLLDDSKPWQKAYQLKKKRVRSISEAKYSSIALEKPL